MSEEYKQIAPLKVKKKAIKKARDIVTLVFIMIWIWQGLGVWQTWGWVPQEFIYGNIIFGLIGAIAVFVVYVYCKRKEAQLQRKMEQLAKGRKYLL